MPRNRYTKFQLDPNLPKAEQLAKLEKARQLHGKLSAADEKASIKKGEKLLNEWVVQVEAVKKAQALEQANFATINQPNKLATLCDHSIDIKDEKSTLPVVSQKCLLAIGLGYIEPSHALTFAPEVHAVLFSPDGMEAFRLGIISGALVEKLLSQKETNESVTMLKKFIDPANRLDYLKDTSKVSLEVYPSNSPKVQF